MTVFVHTQYTGYLYHMLTIDKLMNRTVQTLSYSACVLCTSTDVKNKSDEDKAMHFIVTMQHCSYNIHLHSYSTDVMCMSCVKDVYIVVFRRVSVWHS